MSVLLMSCIAFAFCLFFSLGTHHESAEEVPKVFVVAPKVDTVCLRGKIHSSQKCHIIHIISAADLA
jgi:hypothetical protein